MYNKNEQLGSDYKVGGFKGLDTKELNSAVAGNLDGKLVVVPPDSSKGFNFGYVMFIPNNISDNTTLIIEGSNVRKTMNSLEEANAEILRTGLNSFLPIHSVANKLGLPLLYPLFPRIFNDRRETIYNHMLSSRCFEDNPIIKECGLERTDLQLINMFKDATHRFSLSGITVSAEFILSGFSSSAKFANRFSILHPEYVKACIAGGISGTLTLPHEEIDGEKLFWPVGIANVEELTGELILDEQIECFKSIPQFYYMGLEDSNDPFEVDENMKPIFHGIISEEEAKLIYEIYGSHMINDRYPKTIEIYRDLGINATFKGYPGVGHDPRPAEEDILNFIKKVLSIGKVK